MNFFAKKFFRFEKLYYICNVKTIKVLIMWAVISRNNAIIARDFKTRYDAVKFIMNSYRDGICINQNSLEFGRIEMMNRKRHY